MTLYNVEAAIKNSHVVSRKIKMRQEAAATGERNFFSFIYISWKLITLQYCSGFCHTLI